MSVSKPFKAKFKGECVAGDWFKPGDLIVWDSQEHWMENVAHEYRILHCWHVTCYSESIESNKEKTQ